MELEQGSDTQAEGSEQSAESEQNAESEQAPAELQDSEPLGTQALEEQIEALKQELLDTKDQALRTVADAQNVKRRAEKEVTNARKFALEKFASELLGVVDNLERTVEAVDKDNEALKQLVEGVELTQKSLMDTLVKHKITPLDPLGEPFDPQFHQAMSMVENPDVEPNTVTLVMQKGYSLHGRLLRPAMVMVSKAPAGSVDEKA
ncbi:MAG: nucleotide exchange factor GrpE [Spongiibacteraceae bacterium]|nr:nucleotide exchange factor GrpE [Spongiibacteraceae bacterium]